MPISNKQKKILAFPYTKNYQSLICDGSVRSGKTSLMTVAFIDWAMREFDGCNFGICGKTVNSAKRNIINPYLSMTYHKGRYSVKFTHTDNRLTVKQGNKINTFYVFGGKDEGSAALIQGVTLAGILLDEVALMPRSFVEQSLARCSFENAKFWFSCNPENPGHWFYKEWIMPENHIAKKILHLHFLMTDNPSLSEETLARYDTMYSGVFRRRYVLGEWIAADGLIYDMFDKAIHVVPNADRAYTRYYVSCDYGTQNPTTFGLWGQCGAVWYLIREYYYSGRDERKQKTDEEYVEDYLKFVAGLNITAMIVDPSAASFIAALSQRGIPVMKADNDVLDGIRLTASLLMSGAIKICEYCTKTIEEFGLYIWDKKAIGEDRPVKENDHCLTGDTIINTCNGDFRIDELVNKSGLVWCYDESARQKTQGEFYDVRCTQKDAPVFEIELENGKIFKATAEHPVLTNSGWKPIKDLSGCDKVLDLSQTNTAQNDSAPQFVGIKTITNIGKHDVYNMEVSEHHNFSVNGGIIVHNCMDQTRYFCKTILDAGKQWHFA